MVNTLLKITIPNLTEILIKYPDSYITEKGELAVLSAKNTFVLHYVNREVFGKTFLVDKGSASSYLILGEYTPRGIVFGSKMYIHKDLCVIEQEWELN